MAVNRPRATTVVCTACEFSRTVTHDDDRLPAEIVIEHGKRTGHLLRVSPLEE